MANGPRRGDCRQCWQHAYDKSIHRALGPKQDCQPCLDHMVRGCPESMIVR